MLLSRIGYFPAKPHQSPILEKSTKREKRGNHLPSKTPICWSLEHSAVVSYLVDMLTILGYPDFDLIFVLHTDA